MTVGIQYKPIVPNGLLRARKQELTQDGINFTVTQRFGFSGGMVIRKGLSKMWSLETGINLVVRKFLLEIDDPSRLFTGSSKFAITAYEVPVLGLLYVRLGERIYMNTALGISLDIYPSNISTKDIYYDHFSLRKGWIQAGLLANHGYEYRTREKGYFYVGASFHRPFIPIYDTRVTYVDGSNTATVETELSGNYFTVDIRYFFHEDPEKKKERKKKMRKKAKKPVAE